MGNVLLGWICLTFFVLLAALMVFFNIINWDNVVPTVLGAVWSSPSIANETAIPIDKTGIIMMGQWAKFVMPCLSVLIGLAIFYVEVVRNGDSNLPPQ